MHSRIFQIEKEPIKKEDYIDSFSIPEWFTESVADYASDDSNREEDIEWLMSAALGSIASVEGNKIIFSSDINEYFKEKYKEFANAAKELYTATLTEFISGDSIDMALFRLKSAYDDRYSFYIYSDYDLCTLDDFMRHVKAGETYFIGGTVDYHF